MYVSWLFFLFKKLLLFFLCLIFLLYTKTAMSMVLPLSNLKLRLSQVDYTVSAPCTHTLTPTQAVAMHYAHTYVFTSLGIFHTLPCHTHSDIRTRTHTHFHQPITGRQSILNADTEYSKNAQIDCTASAPCAHAHTYTGSCYAHTYVFTSLGSNTHICVPAHIRTYTPLITGRHAKHFNADTDTSQHFYKNARFGRAKVPAVRGLPLLDPHPKHCCRLGGTHMHMDGGPDMEPEV